MFKNSLVAILFISLLSSQSLMAQTEDGLDGLVSDTKNDLLVVVGGGLAGAVLGLSTLSFVDEPKDHTRNIIVGASIGIIGAVGYVAFSQANKTSTMIYGDGEEVYIRNNKEFNTYARSGWHHKNLGETYTPILSPYSLAYNLRF